MNCPKCGSENEDGSLFCETCGSALSPQAAQRPAAATASAAFEEAAVKRRQLINDAQVRLAEKSTQNESERIERKLKMAIGVSLVLGAFAAAGTLALCVAAADGREIPASIYAGCILYFFGFGLFPLGCAAISEWACAHPSQRTLVLAVSIILGILTSGMVISIAGAPGLAYLIKRNHDAKQTAPVITLS